MAKTPSTNRLREHMVKSKLGVSRIYLFQGAR
jgi:hypothetical protein